MVFSPVLSYPTIDKIELITDNFYLNSDNHFRQLPEFYRGEKIREKSIYNSAICNMIKPKPKIRPTNTQSHIHTTATASSLAENESAQVSCERRLLHEIKRIPKWFFGQVVV